MANHPWRPVISVPLRYVLDGKAIDIIRRPRWVLSYPKDKDHLTYRASWKMPMQISDIVFMIVRTLRMLGE